jgi:FtsH-binding integral membrane protein
LKAFPSLIASNSVSLKHFLPGKSGNLKRSEPSAMDERQKEQEQEKMSFDAYRLMVVWLFLATLLACVITFFSVYKYEQNEKGATILMVVMIAGILGSFVSALNRIYSSRDIFPHQRYKDLLKGANSYLIIYSIIPPMIGAIASVVLYLVFAGELINGSLFPSFDCAIGEGRCNSFENFVLYWKPETSADFARAIVWGFLAGFSERLVPDILNRIAQSTESNPGKK